MPACYVLLYALLGAPWQQLFTLAMQTKKRKRFTQTTGYSSSCFDNLQQ